MDLSVKTKVTLFGALFLIVIIVYLKKQSDLKKKLLLIISILFNFSKGFYVFRKKQRRQLKLEDHQQHQKKGLVYISHTLYNKFCLIYIILLYFNCEKKKL